MTVLVTGVEGVKQGFAALANKVVARVTEAVEMSTVDIVNSAKANHQAGAHAAGRYENQTTLLTNSMQPSEPEIVGTKIVGTAGAYREYAADVELGTPTSRPYPYMYPAMVENADRAKQRIAEAVKGN